VLLVNFVRRDFYDNITRITHDKEKGRTNIYKIVCGKEECVASLSNNDITAIYDYDDKGGKSGNMVDMWLMNKGLVSFQDGKGKGFDGETCGEGPEEGPVQHDFYVICYPYKGNQKDYKVVVEEFEHPHFNHDFLAAKYGNYIRWGPYEQENWAVKAALKVEDDIQKLHGKMPNYRKRPE